MACNSCGSNRPKTQKPISTTPKPKTVVVTKLPLSKIRVNKNT